LVKGVNSKKKFFRFFYFLKSVSDDTFFHVPKPEKCLKTTELARVNSSTFCDFRRFVLVKGVNSIHAYVFFNKAVKTPAKRT